jgi:hypothetical protein
MITDDSCPCRSDALRSENWLAERPAFIVNLLSHNRPMAEVLAPTRKNIEEKFARGFQGMTAEPISLDELKIAREPISLSKKCGSRIGGSWFRLSEGKLNGHCWKCPLRQSCQRSDGDSRILTSFPRWRGPT